MAEIIDEPAHATIVTPSDISNLAKPAAKLVLSNFGAGAAAIKVTTTGGDTLTIALGTPGVAALPFVLPLQVLQVWATGTAAVGTITALSR